MLYVQMQLCERTLRQWLDIRNKQESSVVNVKQSLAIFQQVVSGVCYIHSQSIVHHDIKVSLLDTSFSSVLVHNNLEPFTWNRVLKKVVVSHLMRTGS